MVMMKKRAAVAGTFGVAMSALYAAPDLQADVVAINFSPDAIPWGWTATNFTVGMTAAGLSAAFAVDNNSSWGKNFYGPGFNAFGLSNLQQVGFSSFISPGGLNGNVANFASTATGTVFIGFQTTGGNVGWFSVNLGGAGGDNVILGGSYGNAGETLHVGTAIPEPSSAVGLSLLALGAAGLRRRRTQPV